MMLWVAVAVGGLVLLISICEKRKISKGAVEFAKRFYPDHQPIAVSIFKDFCAVFGVTTEKVVPDANLHTEFGLDEEWELLELVAMIESLGEGEPDIEKVAALQTIDDLVQFAIFHAARS